MQRCWRAARDGEPLRERNSAFSDCSSISLSCGTQHGNVDFSLDSPKIKGRNEELLLPRGHCKEPQLQQQCSGKLKAPNPEGL